MAACATETLTKNKKSIDDENQSLQTVFDTSSKKTFIFTIKLFRCDHLTSQALTKLSGEF